MQGKPILLIKVEIPTPTKSKAIPFACGVLALSQLLLGKASPKNLCLICCYCSPERSRLAPTAPEFSHPRLCISSLKTLVSTSNMQSWPTNHQRNLLPWKQIMKISTLQWGWTGGARREPSSAPSYGHNGCEQGQVNSRGCLSL